MAVLLEPGREVHIAATVDVAVAGGGIAGVAAALAAARTGAQTLLLEKECALGGLATLGLIVMYLPLCDGYGHQVIGGIGEELLRKSVEGGSPTAGPRGHVPPCWNGPAGEAERTQTRFRVDYDAAPMMLTLERLLREAWRFHMVRYTAVRSAKQGRKAQPCHRGKQERTAGDCRAGIRGCDRRCRPVFPGGRANGILFGKPEKRLVLFHARGGKRASAPPHRSAEGPLSTGKPVLPAQWVRGERLC